MWLTSQQHRRGEISNLARFVEKEGTWPGWQDRQRLESSLQDQNPAMLPTLAEAWTEYKRAIIEGWEY